MNEPYMIRAQRTQIWHLPFTPGQDRGIILCGAPNRGIEERLWPPNQPKRGDGSCPECQQLRQAQEKGRSLAEAGEEITETE